MLLKKFIIFTCHTYSTCKPCTSISISICYTSRSKMMNCIYFTGCCCWSSGRHELQFPCIMISCGEDFIQWSGEERIIQGCKSIWFWNLDSILCNWVGARFVVNCSLHIVLTATNLVAVISTEEKYTSHYRKFILSPELRCSWYIKKIVK